MQVSCPECGDRYSVQGLYGHLTTHDLHGPELEEKYREARRQDQMKMERTDRSPRSPDNSTSSDGAELAPVPNTAVSAEKSSGQEASGEEWGGDRERKAQTIADIPEIPDSQGSSSESRSPSVPQEAEAEIIEEATQEADGEHVGEALDRYRRALHRLETAKETTGQEVTKTVTDDSGGLPSKFVRKLIGTDKTEKTVTERTDAEAELLEQCREEVEKAEANLRRALDHRQVEHDHNRTESRS